MTAATAFHNSLWGSTGLIEGGRVHSLILISWFSQFLSWSMRWFSFFFFDSLQAHLKSSIPQFVSVFCWCFSVLLHSHPEAETSASRCKHAQRKDVHIPLLTWVYGWWIWLDYIIRPPWQKRFHRVFIHIAVILLKLSFRELTLKKQVKLAQGRFDRTWEFNLYHSRHRTVSLTARPPSRYSLKAISMHCFVVVVKYDEACILGRRLTGRQWSRTLSQMWDVL